MAGKAKVWAGVNGRRLTDPLLRTLFILPTMLGLVDRMHYRSLLASLPFYVCSGETSSLPQSQISPSAQSTSNLSLSSCPLHPTLAKLARGPVGRTPLCTPNPSFPFLSAQTWKEEQEKGLEGSGKVAVASFWWRPQGYLTTVLSSGRGGGAPQCCRPRWGQASPKA